ncbi:MAG: hypothetical protein GC162_16330 [Planctomycetes bacterium]|nr:hypothetical protein [Planctomycetota bacterium]
MSERFTITVEHPGDRQAATLALKLALKDLLRRHRLRCVEVSRIDPHVEQAIERQRRIDTDAASIPITPRACGALPVREIER